MLYKLGTETKDQKTEEGGRKKENGEKGKKLIWRFYRCTEISLLPEKDLILGEEPEM